MEIKIRCGSFCSNHILLHISSDHGSSIKAQLYIHNLLPQHQVPITVAYSILLALSVSDMNMSSSSQATDHSEIDPRIVENNEGNLQIPEAVPLSAAAALDVMNTEKAQETERRASKKPSFSPMSVDISMSAIESHDERGVALFGKSSDIMREYKLLRISTLIPYL
jgi:hypothetical protein